MPVRPGEASRPRPPPRRRTPAKHHRPSTPHTPPRYRSQKHAAASEKIKNRLMAHIDSATITTHMGQVRIGKFVIMTLVLHQIRDLDLSAARPTSEAGHLRGVTSGSQLNPLLSTLG
jgi:hypothetical protein